MLTNVVAVPAIAAEDDIPDSFTGESAFDLGLACEETRIWMEVRRKPATREFKGK